MGNGMPILNQGTKSDLVKHTMDEDPANILDDSELICALDDAWLIYESKRSKIAQDNLYVLMNKIVDRGNDNVLASEYMKRLLNEAWFYYCSCNEGESANKSVDLLYARFEKAKELGFTGIADEFMKKRIALNKKQA